MGSSGSMLWASDAGCFRAARSRAWAFRSSYVLKRWIWASSSFSMAGGTMSNTAHRFPSGVKGQEPVRVVNFRSLSSNEAKYDASSLDLLHRMGRQTILVSRNSENDPIGSLAKDRRLQASRACWFWALRTMTPASASVLAVK